MKLSNEDLKSINGGVSTLGAIGIAAGVVFAVGVIDGWARPPKCRQ